MVFSCYQPVWNRDVIHCIHCVGDVGAPQTWSPYPEKLLWVSTMPEEDAVSLSSIIPLSKPLWNRSTELICLIREHLRSEPEQAPASCKWEESWTLRVKKFQTIKHPREFFLYYQFTPCDKGQPKVAFNIDTLWCLHLFVELSQNFPLLFLNDFIHIVF